MLQYIGMFFSEVTLVRHFSWGLYLTNPLEDADDLKSGIKTVSHISLTKALLKMIYLFLRWDMLGHWRVYTKFAYMLGLRTPTSSRWSFFGDLRALTCSTFSWVVKRMKKLESQLIFTILLQRGSGSRFCILAVCKIFSESLGLLRTPPCQTIFLLSSLNVSNEK